MNLIRNKYPVNTAEQVKVAQEYFATHIDSFSHTEKMLAAARLEKRAHELNVEINQPWVVNYARPLHKTASVSPDMERNFEMRKKACDNDDITIGGAACKYSDMLDKLAADSTMSVLDKIHTLTSLDKLAGLEEQGYKNIPDPVMAIAGSNLTPEFDAVKIAGDLTDYDLRRMACNKEWPDTLAREMGEKVAEDFSNDPVQTVYSMSVGDKEVFLNLLG